MFSKMHKRLFNNHVKCVICIHCWTYLYFHYIVIPVAKHTANSKAYGKTLCFFQLSFSMKWRDCPHQRSIGALAHKHLVWAMRWMRHKSDGLARLLACFSEWTMLIISHNETMNHAHHLHTSQSSDTVTSLQYDENMFDFRLHVRSWWERPPPES